MCPNASVEGCEACHGEPYLKHGYRAAEVEGLPAFAACKECHIDDKAGGHLDWQWMVDEPFQWATNAAPADFTTKYAYKLQRDAGHAPDACDGICVSESMANCFTCHQSADKIAAVTDDDFFTAETCRSCHPVNGKDAWATQKYNQPKRAPALTELWTAANVATSTTSACLAATATRRAVWLAVQGIPHRLRHEDLRRFGPALLPTAANKVSIDAVTLTGNVLDVKFSAGNAAIVPELTVSFYGYDAKHMLVSSHTRDAGAATCYNDRAADP